MKPYIVRADGDSPYRNLALEEYLIDTCPDDGVILYLWQNSDTVVIGRNQNPWRECNLNAMYRDGVLLSRRTSGGGAVFQDAGNLNYTFVAVKEHYSQSLQNLTVLTAFRALGLDVCFSGRNDMLLDGKKFSGCAFTHKSRVSMQHGTLLISTDPDRVQRYLTPSPLKLKAKGIASVRSRVCRLNEYLPGFTTDDAAQALTRCFSSLFGKPEPLAVPKVLPAQERLASKDWLYGETPSFDLTLENRFDFGEVQLNLSCASGVITAVRLYTDALDITLPETVEKLLTGCPAAGAAEALKAAGMPQLALLFKDSGL